MEEKRQFVHGLEGLAKLLGISLDSAGQLSKSGIIDEATIMCSPKKRMYNAGLVLELLKKSNIGKKQRNGGENGK